MILQIAQLGQAVLRQKAADIPPEEIATPEFQRLLQDMQETLRSQKGAGLAGPQVFTSRRVFLAGVLSPSTPDGPRGIEVFINPRFTAASAETDWSWEGCLSFPELLVLVQRHQAVRNLAQHLGRGQGSQPRTRGRYSHLAGSRFRRQPTAEAA